jgi:hypothetical protein
LTPFLRRHANPTAWSGVVADLVGRPARPEVEVSDLSEALTVAPDDLAPRDDAC